MQNKSNDFLNYKLLFCVLISGTLIWQFCNKTLVKAYILIKKYELIFISHFVDNENIQKTLEGLEMAYANPDQLSSFYTKFIGDLTGLYLAWPLFLVGISLLVMMVKRLIEFIKTHSQNNIEFSQKVYLVIPKIISILLVFLLSFMIPLVPEFAELLVVIAFIITIIGGNFTSNQAIKS